MAQDIFLILKGFFLFVKLFFLLIVSFLAMAYLFATMRVREQPGYPWPGHITYDLPGLMSLFLGFVWVAGLVTASVVERPRKVDSVLNFFLLGIVGGGIFRALTPAAGLSWSTSANL